jgi:hypothetical protein
VTEAGLFRRSQALESSKGALRNWREQRDSASRCNLNPWRRLTFDISGLPQAGPLDGGVRRTTLSKEMPGTRRHQRTGAGVRPPLGGTKALRDVLHLDFGRQPTRWAAPGCQHFHPGRPCKPTLERQRASCKYGALEGRLAVLGLPGAPAWAFAEKATSAATRYGNGIKEFLELPNVRRKGPAAGRSP